MPVERNILFSTHALEQIRHDANTDTLCITLRQTAVAASDGERPGVILDYDAEGNLVSLEILEAYRRVENPGAVIFTN